MNFLLYALFLSIFFLDYFAFKLSLIPRYITWIPDVMSIFFMALVPLLSTRRQNAFSSRWIVFFIAFLCIILMGSILNQSSAGTMFVGSRAYLKFLPFFLLPMVYNFSEIQIKNQLRFLLFIILLQGPLGVFQKFIQYGIKSSGDRVTGTMTSAGQLPIMLAGAVAFLTALYLKGKIKLPLFLLILAIIIAPTTLAESKASIGFLPVAFLAPIWVNMRNSEQKRKIGKAVGVILLFICTAVAFVTIYDYFAQFGRESRREGIVAFFTSGTAETYLNRGAVDKTFIDHLGYVDIIALPFNRLSDDPWKLFFGLGIGGVTGSALEGMSGEYAKEYGKYGAKESAAALFLWEIGIFGVLIYFAFIFMVFFDAKKICREEGIAGVIGLGWSAAILVAFVSFFFRNLFLDNANGYLFWYFSGYVAAARYRLQSKAKSKGTPKTNEAIHWQPIPQWSS